MTAVAVVLAVLLEIPWIALAGIPFLALALFVPYFFRDPERTCPPGDGNILSPADGVVTHVCEVDSVPYLDGPAKKVSIFMSLFNVHVNRAPLSGKVEFVEHTPGRFHNAGHEVAITENENNVVGFKNDWGKFVVKQIAGVVARRIVCAVGKDDELVRGMRIGMIKFGSRLEVFVPAETPCEFKVKPGDKVKAGETIVGVLGE